MPGNAISTPDKAAEKLLLPRASVLQSFGFASELALGQELAPVPVNTANSAQNHAARRFRLPFPKPCVSG
jgi:hypothetical protein